MKITLVQSDIHWENSAENLQHQDRLLADTDMDADLVILPEMFNTGFTMNAVHTAQSNEGEAQAWMKSKAKKLDVNMVGSIATVENGVYYNRLLWVTPDGQIQGKYDKKHLFSMAGEDKVYTPGQKKLLINIKNWQILPFICYDLRFPVWSRNVEKAGLFIYIANWPDKRQHAWRNLLIARAIENQCYVAGVNRVGWDGNQIHYSGGSIVVDPEGHVIADLVDEERVETVSLSSFTVQDTRQKLPFLKDMDEFNISI